VNISFSLPRSWPGTWTRVIIIVVIFVAIYQLDPGWVIMLILGGWLGAWAAAPAGLLLTTSPARST
jgi:hypothetical protein